MWQSGCGRAAEPVLFFRREPIEDLGGFDNLIGTGAQTPRGAGEGTDLCIWALKSSYRVSIEPSLLVYHERVEVRPDNPRQLNKVYSYAQGMGAVI